MLETECEPQLSVVNDVNDDSMSKGERSRGLRGGGIRHYITLKGKDP